jgi:thioesterase domain-containing protein/acyl carrier protein
LRSGISDHGSQASGATTREYPDSHVGAAASSDSDLKSQISDLKSRGELREPRLYRTGDRARWLPDGTIEFLGRIDRQVKIRGFRVEPAEIEAVLASHGAVKDCAVVVRTAPSGEKRLVAYVVSNQTPVPAIETWRAFLAERLPEYFVPSVFHCLETLPLTANGKLDEAALPVDDGLRPDLRGHYVAPRDDIEHQLAEIWADVLGVRPVGVNDQFFALGGHSLLAVRMIARLEKTFGKKMPVAAIFQHRTIAELAKLLHSPARTYAPTTSIVEIHGKGTRWPLYLVHGVGGGMFWGYSNLARHLGPDQPLYAFKSRGLDGLPEWPTVEEMAASYVADLRAQQPHGPYLLGGYCFGGIVAYEMARQLRQQGEEVSLLALINGSPPNTSYQRASNRWSPVWLAKFAGNFAYWLGCFAFRWTWHERTEFVRWKLGVMRRRTMSGAQKHAEVALGDIDQLVDLAAYSDERRALWRAHVQALIKYRPQPYDGEVTLIRTRGHPLLCSFDWQYGWGELAHGVEVNVVRGGHGNVLAEPYVKSVAQVLQRRLARLSAVAPQEVKS